MKFRYCLLFLFVHLIGCKGHIYQKTWIYDEIILRHSREIEREKGSYLIIDKIHLKECIFLMQFCIIFSVTMDLYK